MAVELAVDVERAVTTLLRRHWRIVFRGLDTVTSPKAKIRHTEMFEQDRAMETCLFCLTVCRTCVGGAGARAGQFNMELRRWWEIRGLVLRRRGLALGVF